MGAGRCGRAGIRASDAAAEGVAHVTRLESGRRGWRCRTLAHAGTRPHAASRGLTRSHAASRGRTGSHAVCCRSLGRTDLCPGSCGRRLRPGAWSSGVSGFGSWGGRCPWLATAASPLCPPRPAPAPRGDGMSSAPTHGDADLTRSGLTPLDPDDVLSPVPGRGSGRRPAHTQVAGTRCGQLQPTVSGGRGRAPRHASKPKLHGISCAIKYSAHDLFSAV